MRIGITGTIGSGKTEACNYIRSKGYEVFDCDETNRYLLNTKAYILLNDYFSECFEGYKLNKDKLASVVFNNPDKKRLLESVMHPLILKEMLNKNEDPLFAEVPLLFESAWDKYFDITLLIVCNEDIAIQRLENRGFSKDKALERIKNQMPVEEKIKKATRIIYNNGDLNDLYHTIDEFISQILC